MTSSDNRHRCAWCVVAGILLSVVLPSAGWSQPTAPMPPAAQEAVDKGLLAARVPDYLLAIRFFEDARKIAPDAPVIYLNLGLAESKLPGRTLRAMAWFGAYLAAYPDAPNAAAVKSELAMQTVKSQSATSNLIRAAQDAASHLASDNAFSDVATLWAKSGDLVAALSTVDLLKSDISKGSALRQISVVQAKSGDVTGAMTTADLIQRADYKTQALKEIGMAQTDAKDAGGARVTLLAAAQAAELIADLQTKGYEQNMIARAQIDAGDIPGARSTVLAALKTADLVPMQTPVAAMIKTDIQLYSGDTYLRAKDVASAKTALAAAYNNSRLMDDPDVRSYNQTRIAQAQAKAGDLANAEQSLAAAQISANLLQGERRTALLNLAALGRVDFAEAQVKAGDIAGAKKTAALFAGGDQKKAIEKAIAEAQNRTPVPETPAPADSPSPSAPTVSAKPPIPVSEWLAKLDSKYQLNSAPFLDLAGYLKALPASDSPQKVFEGLAKTADEVVGTQKAVIDMLNQQAGK